MNTLSLYLVKPRHVNMIATRNVISYLKGTIDFRLCYDIDHDYRLCGYIDSYWEGSDVERNITSGGCYCMGSAI